MGREIIAAPSRPLSSAVSDVLMLAAAVDKIVTFTKAAGESLMQPGECWLAADQGTNELTTLLDRIEREAKTIAELLRTVHSELKQATTTPAPVVDIWEQTRRSLARRKGGG